MCRLRILGELKIIRCPGSLCKTSLLEPGACETLTLTVPVSSFASYDEKDANKNGFQGYELEAGIYELSLRSHAHHPAAMDQNTIRLYVPAGTLYDTDRITGAPVFNKFTGNRLRTVFP